MLRELLCFCTLPLVFYVENLQKIATCEGKNDVPKFKDRFICILRKNGPYISGKGG